jgi:phosphotriesterase-related protein
MDQLAIVEACGYSPSRFISIHTQAEPDFAMHLKVARRGAWIEYDGIGGWGDDETYVENINRVSMRGWGTSCCSATTAAGMTRRNPAAARRSLTPI